ncbi:MAG: hypothetical protein KDK23_00390 [Leptospiraceae bacterium]|nr:hypothetical protein [Leptospiraceae bacterium]
MKPRRRISIALGCLLAMAGSLSCETGEGNDAETALAAVALLTAVVPPRNCDFTVETSPGNSSTQTRVLYFPAVTSQDMFTSHSEGVDSTEALTVYLEVTANVGTRLELTNFAQSSPGIRVVTPYKNSGCPADLTSASKKTTAGTEYQETSASSSPRYIEFLQAGTYQIQLYTGDTGGSPPGVPDPIPASDPRPAIRIVN